MNLLATEAHAILQPTVLALIGIALLLPFVWIYLKRRRQRAVSSEMTWQKLIAQKPESAEEALEAMSQMLAHFHAKNDYRAVFLFAYFVITRNVCDAIHRTESGEERVFLDPEWVRFLSGRFASLYFQSLKSSSISKSWALAHNTAAERSGSPLQDLLLGINAHINYDLPIAISQNLKAFNDARTSLGLWRRKFDHDQINNILLRSVSELVVSLPKMYGGRVRAFRRLLFNLDHSILDTGLGYYRERVWWHAVTLTSVKTAGEREIIMRKLDMESSLVGNRICRGKSMVPRFFFWLDRLLRKRTLKKLSSTHLAVGHG